MKPAASVLLGLSTSGRCWLHSYHCSWMDGFARKASITLPFDVQLYQQFALRLRLLVIIFGLDEIPVEPANLPCFPREQHISFLLL